MQSKIDLVIARYNEDLKWLNEYADKKFNKIYVYNKGTTDVVCPLKPLVGDVIYKKLPNVGRCDHSYIHHIIENYNNLGDSTLFIKGSVICSTRALPREPEKFKLTLNKVFETGKSVFIGKRYPPDISESMGDFKLHSYVAGCKVNINSSTDLMIHPANPPMFGDWYRKRFPHLIGDSKEDRVCFAGIFAISNDDIHNRKKADYKPFLDELAEHSNPSAGHFIERSWLALFYKIPDECFYENITLWQGGRRRSTRKQKKRRHFKKYSKTY